MAKYIFEESLSEDEYILIENKLTELEYDFYLTEEDLTIKNNCQKYEIEQFLKIEGIGFEI